MKIVAFGVRPDEKNAFEKISNELNLEVVIHSESPSIENLDYVKGYEAVSFIGLSEVDSKLLDEWHKLGVKYISTRTIGFNHIDLVHAKKLGIRACNAIYAPNGVSEFTVMMILMCLRQYKASLWLSNVNDFSLDGIQGKELKDLTVGILGTGNIGAQVIKNLTGFGCKILTYDVNVNKDILPYAEYVSLEDIYEKCDLISLHLPLLESTKHIINDESISKMKNNVIIVNCARGGLCDTKALIRGIESGKIGALGLDTMENEESFVHSNHKNDIIVNKDLFYLRQFRNVTITPHIAFYTDSAVFSMVKYSLEGLKNMAEGKKCVTEL